MRITVERGDITRYPVDAIVNAANPYLRGGGGVDGAIHRAAGPKLLEACQAIPILPGQEDVRGVPYRCPVGDARITPGFDLPAEYVIHAVGPVYANYPVRQAEKLFLMAHLASLKLAEENGCKTIAFPALSCGLYGFPIPRAASLSVRLMIAIEQESPLDEVLFVMFTEETYEAWRSIPIG